MSMSQKNFSDLMAVIVRAEAASAMGKHYEAVRCWASAQRRLHEIGRDLSSEMTHAAWMLNEAAAQKQTQPDEWAARADANIRSMLQMPTHIAGATWQGESERERIVFGKGVIYGLQMAADELEKNQSLSIPMPCPVCGEESCYHCWECGKSVIEGHANGCRCDPNRETL